MARKKVFQIGDTAFLADGNAIVTMSDFTDMVTDKDFSPITVDKPKTGPGKELKFVPRGDSNNLPNQIMDKVYKNITVASNVDFNSRMAYGDGIMVMKKVRNPDTKKIEFQEQIAVDCPDIFKFLEDNNYMRTSQELSADMSVFSEGYVEFVLDKNSPPRIVRIKHREVDCSRVSQAVDGVIEYHGYSAKWMEATQDDLISTVLLDSSCPILDMKQKLGIELMDDSRKNDCLERRFVLSLGLPTPGRYYYNKSYWWSIFASGWYDFACAIPSFKKSLLKNQMVLKYHVSINKDFWAKLFKDEGITDDKKKDARKTAFLTQMNEFLSGEENAGKSFVSHFDYDKVKGFEAHDILIKPIESFFKGGEYIEDSEEVINLICYAMGIHPSVIGASPGKNKSINGTEARELFIIKQAMMKPVRDMLVLPLYMAKAINGWDPDIHFVIPNIMLTTLDQGTGAVKSIGNQKV